ncbi:MAG: class I SAM-dependent methyltransferase [bacterium]|nr:class I SAM-dependent methyltransferase [bacterium]
MNELDRSYGSVTARFYDAAYEAISEQRRDGEFYASLAREAGGPVLELGCGTGRVLLEIAAQGYPCTGVDASQAMLNVLRDKRPPPTLHLVCAPMQAFEFEGEDERFALIFSGFRVFQHLDSIADQLACLERVRRYLTPGGIFAFDVFRPRMQGPDSIPEREQLRFELEGDQVVRYETVERDRARQSLHVRMRYEVHRAGEVVANEFSDFDMRWFYRYELEHLLARAGFEDVMIYGDFDRSPISVESPSFVVVAR